MSIPSGMQKATGGEMTYLGKPWNPGTLLGSVTMCLTSFGLQAIFSAEMGSAITMVITGAFVLVINTASSQGGVWIATIKKSFTSPKTAA